MNRFRVVALIGALIVASNMGVAAALPEQSLLVKLAMIAIHFAGLLVATYGLIRDGYFRVE